MNKTDFFTADLFKEILIDYLGLSNITDIIRQLIERGCPKSMPFAVMAQGASNQQQVIVVTISDID